MRPARIFLSLVPATLLLTACGGDDKTTVIREQPIVIQQPATAAPVIVHDHN